MTVRDPHAGPADRPMQPDHQRLQLTTTCTRCRRPIAGWIEFDQMLRVVDTEAFMLFENGPKCDGCLVARRR
jgi:hypothetical protein